MTLKHWLTFSLLVGVTLCSYAVSAAEPTSAEVFERRILPIFKSPNPSSCTQCHLAGVDLKDYILPSHEKTFLSLRDQGIIDFDNPDDSKILHLIAMGGTNGVAGEGAALIGAKVRALELAAFAEWIRASARDPELRAAPRPAYRLRNAPFRTPFPGQRDPLGIAAPGWSRAGGMPLTESGRQRVQDGLGDPGAASIPSGPQLADPHGDSLFS